MEMTMIGPYNPTPAEREVMENIAAESQAAPDSEFRYFVYNPLDKTTHYYRSEAVQQRAAAAILRSCCVDGDWDEAAVAQIAMGVVTHTPQRVLLQTEPQPADYADASAYTQAHDAWEEDCDEHGEVWTYRMLPLAAPGAGHESRADAIGVLKAAVWRQIATEICDRHGDQLQYFFRHEDDIYQLSDAIGVLKAAVWRQIATETRYEAASNGWVRATLPFCDRHGDRLQYFFRHEDDTYQLSDDGALVRDLLACSQLPADTGSWRRSLTARLAVFGVELNGDALYMRCDAGQFSHKFGDYLHALLVVADPAFSLAAAEEQP